MNLKQRFALLFTLFVSIILLICCTSIYLLYNDYRKSDFYSKLIIEGNEVYKIFTKIKSADTKVTEEFIREVYEQPLLQEKLMIVDKDKRIVFKMPDSSNEIIPIIDKNKFKAKENYEFTDENDVQHVVIYKAESESYIFLTGVDKIGYQKSKSLQIILTIVFFGSLFLSAIMSFLFVNEAIKPIVSLSIQMQNTNIQNLTERVNINHSNDEIGTIANNFNAMLERLNNAFESQKSFVQHASHELRTPLAIMLSQTEAALRREQSIDEYKKTLYSLKEDQHHLIDLTNSLLLISQNDHLTFLTDKSLLRVDELLYDSILIAKKIYPDLVIEFNFETIPANHDDLIIDGIDSLLKSTFFNLIKNAYQYSSDKKLQIKLFVGDKAVKIKFQNRGLQLTASESQKMFIPFFRGGNAGNKKGFGLGLSIIHRILELHNGELSYLAVGDDMNEFEVQLLIA